jgi:predicted outer membrane repeat protein
MRTRTATQQADARLRAMHRALGNGVGNTWLRAHRSLPRGGMAAALALTAAFGATHCASVAAANTYTVNTAGDPGPGGTLSLRQAITAANASAGNTIQFASALKGSTITLLSGQIAISQPMTITGPGAGQLTVSGNDASRIFYIRPVPDNSNPDSTPVTISGVTLTHGGTKNVSGGAVFTSHSKLLLSHSTISYSKGFVGGGIFSRYAKTQIEYSRLIGNQATHQGGALYSTLDTSVNILFDTISGNSAGEIGGGIRIGAAGYAVINGSTISGNIVPQPSSDYGPQGGGGIALSNINSSVAILESTITQNYAASGGAGLAVMDSQTGFATAVQFSTIAGNFAAPYETGIGITSAGGSPLLSYTIIANNVSQTSADDLAGNFYCYRSLIKSPGGATITGSGSLIGLDPLLGPLVDNGGSTFTMLPATTSPVVHAVPCPTCQGNVTDQRSFPRHTPSDMGAVERQYPEPLIFRNGFDPP